MKLKYHMLNSMKKSKVTQQQMDFFAKWRPDIKMPDNKHEAHVLIESVVRSWLKRGMTQR